MGIQLTQEIYTKIVETVQKIEKDDEFEAGIGREMNDSIKSHQFMRALTYISAKYKTNPKIEESLDINEESLGRITINGLQNIIFYCKHKRVENTSIGNDVTMMKKIRQSNPTRLKDYDIVVKLNKELNISDKNTIIGALKKINGESNNNTIYRLKKRFSIISEDGLFRYDFTIVKQSSSLKALIHQNENFEIEVEYVGSKENLGENDTSESIVKNLFRRLSELIKVIDDIDLIISKNDKQKIVKEYSILGYEFDNTNDNNKNFKNNQKLFMGPKPITLEKKHMITMGLNKNTIFDGYTVTDKADGERHLLFVNSTGDCYLINNRMNVKYTGLRSNDTNCIFDCELVKLVNGKKHVMLFDVYFYKKTLKAGLPLIGETSRYSIMKAFADKEFTDAHSQNIYTIKPKTFYHGDGLDMFKNIKKVLNEKSSMYYIDGLIFTPANVPVGAMVQGDKAILKHITWNMAFKWKPPSDNTIDFLVKICKNSNNTDQILYDDGKQYKILSLKVGKNSNIFSQLEYYKNDNKIISRNAPYTAANFEPRVLGKYNYENTSICKLLYENNKLLCESNEEIYDNTIIEMRFDIDNGTWIPLRVRDDKTEQYKNTNSISGTANDYEVACKTWETIINPITLENITGVSQIDEEDVKIEYYKDNGKVRNQSNIFPMKEFHNKWVKDKSLIGLFKNNKHESLIDFACGQGGDLNKWVSAEFQIVLGIDISESNVNNAFSRLLNLRINKNKYLYTFLPMDSSKKLDSQIDTISSIENKRLARLVWGKNQIDKSNRVYNMSRLNNLAAKKFDVGSCQFSLHYFFENETCLEGFLSNLELYIKDKGYFIGTCFDGNAINDLLKDKSMNERVYGTKNDSKIWFIEKNYEGDYNSDFGKKISMYIDDLNNEDNKYDEYLVSFELLVKKIKKHKFRLLNKKECGELGIRHSTGLFDTLYSELMECRENSNLDGKLANLVATMSNAEKQWSFLNRWFIFKKDENYNGSEEEDVFVGPNQIIIDKKDVLDDKPIVKKIVKKEDGKPIVKKIVKKKDGDDNKPVVKKITKKNKEESESETKVVEDVKPVIKRIVKKKDKEVVRKVTKKNEETIAEESESEGEGETKVVEDVKPVIKRIVKKKGGDDK